MSMYSVNWYRHGEMPWHPQFYQKGKDVLVLFIKKKGDGREQGAHKRQVRPLEHFPRNTYVTSSLLESTNLKYLLNITFGLI